MAVLVPIYRDSLSEFEEVSLRNIVTVLKDYPIFFVKPASLELAEVGKMFPQVNQECFDDSFFSNIHAYNTLMLSTAFYERFSRFEYILIAQLDTYIFRDELHQWCAKGYDYVGAPWIVRDIYRNPPHASVLKKIKKCFCDITGKPNSQITGNKVGNGGLSLRKVESHIRATKQLRTLIEQYLSHEKYHLFNEDVFFSPSSPTATGLTSNTPTISKP
ncbi:MAG: hypothetical protein L6U16_04620 [Porphyromonadaceae bacterium]|nr:MAG: hypothetical protein L6U16_04620 [Porphyromonadaceae bacterium]